MDRKSKILVIFFVLVASISVAATYYKYVHLNDYETYTSEMDEIQEEL